MGSKYDRVKVKVILDKKHYYFFSRFLFTKMLCMCRVPETDAVRVSLGLKKYFVDQEKLDITQSELEEGMFTIMSQYGYGDPCKRFFPVMTRFYVNRVPLIIFIAGSGYCGKTDIAHTLSSKLSTHIVSTDMLMDIFASVCDTFSQMGDDKKRNLSSLCAPPDDRIFWLEELDTEETFIELWRNRAEALRPLVDAELDKAVSEGKVLIVEGSLLNLALYRRYFLKNFQLQHGAIVVPFFVTSGDISRRYVVERFLATRGHAVPPGIADDISAAASWMMKRIRAVEEEQMHALLQDASVQWCPIDKEGGEESALMTDWTTSEVLAACGDTSKSSVSNGVESEEGVEGTEKECKEREKDSVVKDADQNFSVYVATYSVAESTKPHEAMHDVVLGNILSAVLQKRVTS